MGIPGFELVAGLQKVLLASGQFLLALQDRFGGGLALVERRALFLDEHALAFDGFALDGKALFFELQFKFTLPLGGLARLPLELGDAFGVLLFRAVAAGGEQECRCGERQKSGGFHDG